VPNYVCFSKWPHAKPFIKDVKKPILYGIGF